VFSKVIGWIDEMDARLIAGKQNLSQSELSAVQKILSASLDQVESSYWTGYLNSLSNQDLKNQLNHAFEYENVVFATSNNARDVGFTVYLPDYNKSMCYLGPNYQDVFTVSHEIGHYYANMYTALNSNSMDLNETHSQSNEMLLLKYFESVLSEDAFSVLESYLLKNFLTNVLIGVLIDEFEYQIYSKPTVETYTSADFDSVMNTVCNKFGGKAKVEKYISNVNNYWRKVVVSQPIYYVSYATSAIGALCLYVKATDDYVGAQECYQYLIEEVDPALGFAKALESAGYLNPFTNSAFSEIDKLVKGVGAVGGKESGGAENLNFAA
jgi:oligoendopeptidase F